MNESNQTSGSHTIEKESASPATEHGTEPVKGRSKRARPYVEPITRHMADIAQDAQVSEAVAFRVAQSFLRKLVQRLTAEDWPENGHLVLSNIGRFEWRHWAPRHGYNPRAREALIIPAQKKLRFVVARQFGESEPLKALNATVAGMSDLQIMPASPRKKKQKSKTQKRRTKTASAPTH